MDERKNTMLLLLLILGALFFVIYHTHISLGELRTDIAGEREFSEKLLIEYDSLVTKNRYLKEQLVEAYENVSRTEYSMQVCLEQTPGLTVDLSPRNRISLEDVVFKQNAVVINVNDIIPGIIAPTGSMAPLFDEDNIVLEVVPESHTEIFPGDVIIYELGGDRIIHRVSRSGWDDGGWFAITKGDNNSEEDPNKVRFSQIKGVVVGVIY